MNDQGLNPNDRAELLEDFGLDDLPPVKAEPPAWHSDPRVGFFPDMSAEDYFADPIEEGSLSNSGLSIIESETMLDFAFQHARINPEAKERALKTAAALRGDIVHQLALGKGKGFAIGDFPDFKTKAAQQWRDECFENGLTPVIASKYEEAEAMAEVVKNRMEQIFEGEPYMTEVTIVWIEETPHGPIYYRGRLDAWCPNKAIILDPKITALIGDGRTGEERMKRHCVNMGWDRQAGIYTRGVERLMPELEGRVRFGNLLIKPEAPFTSRLLWPDNIAKRTAVAECRPSILKFAESMASGKWPGYPLEGEILSLPSFVENRRLDAEIHA